MRVVVAVLVSIVTSGVVAAQPADTAGAPTEPAAESPPPESPPPAETPAEAIPAPAVEAPPKQQLNLEVLTDDERALVRRGYYGDGPLIGGAFLSVFPGFGLGQAVQGRWLQRGWIFTLSQIAGLGLVGYGSDRAKDECVEGERCTSTGVKIYVTGWVLFGGGWLVGALDAFIAPRLHNSRLSAVYRRARNANVTPYVVPARGQDGVTAGVSFSF